MPSTSNHLISLTEAAAMTKRYRDNLVTILQSTYAQSGTLALSETFEKDIFISFINDSDCKSVRIYYGMKENLDVHAIIVGVNENNEDILASTNTSLTIVDDVLFEDSIRCPPSCPEPSPLNED